MASKAQAQKFDKTNRSSISIKNVQGKITRTGQSVGGRKKAHGKIHKH